MSNPITIADVLALAAPAREAKRRVLCERSLDDASDAYFAATAAHSAAGLAIIEALKALDEDDRALLVELYEPLRAWFYR